MRRFIPSFLLSGFLLLTSCTPPEALAPTGTPLPSNTPSPTLTVIWFPPSATPTLKSLPTQTTTPEMSPGIGPVILRDDFSEESVWDTVASNEATAAISRNRLSLAAQPGIYLASLRRDVIFDDFYAEITAHPSLCRGGDSYGILIRSAGDSFYRFTLTCNSMITVERIKNSVRLLMQGPDPSGDAPPGAPGEVRIGVWASASQMRFFLNGRLQASITDPSSPSGAFGVFARGVGDTPISVIFSDLIVYDVNYTPPTRTPIP